MIQIQSTLPLTFCVVYNDNRHLPAIKLLKFKQIIAKALPNMDRPHIIHLLFDHRHESLLAYKGNELIGGTCFAIFNTEVQFAELAFLAVKAQMRTQGYGRTIMNKLKSVLQQRKVSYMITYGDNMALGFFRKQGFSQKITMPRQIYEGTIKEYDGGKLMECKIHPTVDYMNIDKIIKKQKMFVIEKIKQLSSNQIKFSGKNFNDKNNVDQNQFQRKLPNGEVEIFKRDPRIIPGVIQSNWNWEQHDDLKKFDIQSFAVRCIKLVQQIKRYPQAKHFLYPVSSKQVPNYHTIIKCPMDLQTISSKLRNHEYKNEQHICADIQLIFQNCKQFNHPDTVYYKSAVHLQKMIQPAMLAFRNAIINTYTHTYTNGSNISANSANSANSSSVQDYKSQKWGNLSQRRMSRKGSNISL